jgi:hypothetical protein
MLESMVGVEKECPKDILGLNWNRCKAQGIDQSSP